MITIKENERIAGYDLKISRDAIINLGPNVYNGIAHMIVEAFMEAYKDEMLAAIDKNAIAEQAGRLAAEKIAAALTDNAIK